MFPYLNRVGMESAWNVVAVWLNQCLPTGGIPSSVEVHGKHYKVLRELGQGGFSYVYLVQGPGTPGPANLFALKKVPCPFGQESLDKAMKEVEAYRRFQHPSIIHCIDYSVTQESNGTKTVYMVLPYYQV